MKWTLRMLPFAALAIAIVGCGAGNSGSLDGLTNTGDVGGQTLDIGGLTTRIAGTFYPPVTAGEANVVITGVAGGSISSLLLRDTSKPPYETLIAFASQREGSRDIYSMSSDGSDLLHLTNTSAEETTPVWSPNGSKIAFATNRDGNWEIYVMNADGSNPLRLTKNNGDDTFPAWSPNGRQIAFVSTRNGNADIYKMNADGSNSVRLTSHSATDTAPSWSWDGARIAFASERDGNREIYAMNNNGTNQTRLTYNFVRDDSPAWAPGRPQIAFVSERDGTPEIYTMDVDGSNLIRLTSNTSEEYLPRWSSDGSKITFDLVPNGVSHQIYTMNTDGSGQTRVTNDNFNNTAPALSPPILRAIPKRLLLGTGGAFGITAAGFLVGQSGSQMKSVVVFDAHPQTSARITAQTPTSHGLPKIRFTITADSLTSLSFINGTEQAVTRIFGDGGETATGAIVDFDSNTGYVSAVLPYIASRVAGSGAPSITTENGRSILRGKFLGVWDGSGKNDASSGATEVSLDARTGRMLFVK